MGRVAILQGHETPHEIVDLNEEYNFYELSTNEEFIDKAVRNMEEGSGVMIAKYYRDKEKLRALKSMLEVPLMRNIVIINQLSDTFYP